MSPKREKNRKIRKECPSIGSDESGTGGLFGGCSFAAFKLTTDNLKKLSNFDWYQKIKDSKDLSDEENMNISAKIQKNFLPEVDYCIWNITVTKYNILFSNYLGEYKNDPEKTADRVKCIAHNVVHRKINESMAFHVVDNFLGDETERYICECSNPDVIVPIDHFCDKGGHKILSVAVASILARGSYLNKLKDLSKTLGIEMSGVDDHCSDNGHFKLSQLESIFKQLEEKGSFREDVYSKYCKSNWVKKYKKQLKDKNK